MEEVANVIIGSLEISVFHIFLRTKDYFFYYNYEGQLLCALSRCSASLLSPSRCTRIYSGGRKQGQKPVNILECCRFQQNSKNCNNKKIHFLCYFSD